MTESEATKLTYRGRENKAYCDHSVREIINRLADYEDIGTVSEFRELKEKATAIREKAIEEFAEQIKARAHSTERNDWSADYMISIWESVIDEIAETMKGE